jgi:5-methylcytosine-specific restriction endonuclease McrA
VNRDVKALLLDVARGEIGPAIAERARALLDGKPTAAPKKRASQLGAAYAHAKTRRALEDAEETFAKSQMHNDVWRWNLDHTASTAAPHGRCDNPDCQRPFRYFDDGDCDHWIERSQGGEHTRENGWRLCRPCHTDKDGPENEAWNRRRTIYCARAGIPFVPRRTRV